MIFDITGVETAVAAAAVAVAGIGLAVTVGPRLALRAWRWIRSAI